VGLFDPPQCGHGVLSEPGAGSLEGIIGYSMPSARGSHSEISGT
jgi:hypothetical protein